MLNEEIKGLLGEDTISEETAIKLAEIIQEQVNTKLTEQAETLKSEHQNELEKLATDLNAEISTLKEEAESLKTKADEYIAEVKSEIDTRVQSSVDAAVAEFIAENKEQLEQLEDYLRMKAAFATIQEAFEFNGFVLNKNAEVDSLKSELQENTEAYDRLFEQFGETKKTLEEAQMAISFSEATASLAETQKEKVKTLSEGVSFNSVEEYTQALTLIVEQVTAVDNSDATATLQESNKKQLSPRMQKYLDYLK